MSDTRKHLLGLMNGLLSLKFSFKELSRIVRQTYPAFKKY